MRYLIALLVSGVLIVGMFAFNAVMAAKLDEWIAQGAELSFLDKVLLLSTFHISSWGWLIAPLIVLASLGIAALLPQRRGQS